MNKKDDFIKIKVKKLAEEYIKLLQIPNLSVSEVERIAEILTIAMSNDDLNLLLRRADDLLGSNFDCIESDYLHNQRIKLTSYMDSVDELLGEIFPKQEK
jgi:hypothetical protein